MRACARSVNRCCTDRLPDSRFTPGELSAEAGRARVRRVSAPPSATRRPARSPPSPRRPINKLAFSRAGLPWKGHTDLLGHLTGSPRVAMMFWSEPLKVALATIHVPLLPRSLAANLTTRFRGAASIELASRDVHTRSTSGIPMRLRASVSSGSTRTRARTACSATRTRVIAARHRGARGARHPIVGPVPRRHGFMRAPQGDSTRSSRCITIRG